MIGILTEKSLHLLRILRKFLAVWKALLIDCLRVLLDKRYKVVFHNDRVSDNEYDKEGIRVYE